jgi:hypothetical protein
MGGSGQVAFCSGYAFAYISFSTTSLQYGNYLIPSSLLILALTLSLGFNYLFNPFVLDVALVPQLITRAIHSLTHPIHIYSYTNPSPFHSYLLVTYKHSMCVEYFSQSTIYPSYLLSELETLMCQDCSQPGSKLMGRKCFFSTKARWFGWEKLVCPKMPSFFSFEFWSGGKSLGRDIWRVDGDS